MDSSSLILGLRSEWAILLAIFILTSVQLIKVILDSIKTKKEKIERDRRMKVLDKIEVYLRILSEKYTEEVTERQLPVILREFLNHCKEAILVKASSCITKNDIKSSKREVQAKLSQYIDNHFKNTHVSLGLFKWKGRLLSEFIDIKWCDDLKKGILEIVLEKSLIDKNGSYTLLSSLIYNRFDFYTTEALSKAYEM